MEESESMEIDETVQAAPIIEFKQNSEEFLALVKEIEHKETPEDVPNKDDDVVIIEDDEDQVEGNASSAPSVKRRRQTRKDIGEEPVPECDIIDLVHKQISKNSKCINYACPSGEDLLEAPVSCLNYYRVGSSEKKKQEVCRACFEVAFKHYGELASSLLEGKPIADCEFPIRNDLVQIDDSESEDEDKNDETNYFDDNQMSFLTGNFEEVLGDMFKKCDFEKQVRDSLQALRDRNDKVQEKFIETNKNFNQVRKDLDRIYHNVYSNFKLRYENLPAIHVPDHPNYMQKILIGRPEGMAPKKVPKPSSQGVEYVEAVDLPPIPVDLPPKGPIIKPPLKIGETYFMVRNLALGSWTKATLYEIVPPGTCIGGQVFSTNMYGVMPAKYQKTKIPSKRYVNGKELAYGVSSPVQLNVGTRVIAVYREASPTEMKKKDSFYPGVIAEPLSMLNKFRYLIFFDDGYAQYVQPSLVHLVYEESDKVWEDMHVDSRPFIKKYLESYPERPMVRLRKGQQVRTEYNGKWWVSTVMDIDCSLVQMSFTSSTRVEWIYRGSTRLNPMYKEEMAAANRQQNKSRSLRTIHTTKSEAGPYVEYTRNEQTIEVVEEKVPVRSVARKSTAKTPVIRNLLGGTVPFLPISSPKKFVTEPPTSKVVYFTPRSQTNTNMVYKAHTCCWRCKNYITYDVTKLKGYNPLSKPLLCGWNRVTYRHKGKKQINYKAPCGRFIRNMRELHYYLRLTGSEMTVDLFDFDPLVHCLAEFVLEKNATINKDLSNGLETVAIPVVNYVDNAVLDFCNYSTKRQPMEGVNLTLDPEFLCGCDCEDDCQDKLKCHCWKLTLEGYKYLQSDQPIGSIGYTYRRLLEAVSTGIYECNSRCKCRSSCLNRVVQNPLQLKLQVFKTSTRGWGIRCLNDIPKGAFICIYAGSVLTEQMANEGGMNYGDEYLAELDYIEVVEKMKEDYEDDAAETSDDDVKTKKKNEPVEEEKEIVDNRRRKPKNDDRDFVPNNIYGALKKIEDNTGYKARLRKRNEKPEEDEDEKKSNVEKMEKLSIDPDKIEDECVTISDDEEIVREPSSFNPKHDSNLDESMPSRYNSIRQLFGEEEVYIMDAKVTGNIGRFLNHSCSPNVFVQNVFVDTHDVRFPWVAFFALTEIRAGVELTWNYNYDVGSVPGKVLYCHCSSTECRGRLL